MADINPANFSYDPIHAARDITTAASNTERTSFSISTKPDLTPAIQPKGADKAFETLSFIGFGAAKVIAGFFGGIGGGVAGLIIKPFMKGGDWAFKSACAIHEPGAITDASLFMSGCIGALVGGIAGGTVGALLKTVYGLLESPESRDSVLKNIETGIEDGATIGSFLLQGVTTAVLECIKIAFIGLLAPQFFIVGAICGLILGPIEYSQKGASMAFQFIDNWTKPAAT